MTRGIALDGENWCEVLNGQLIITPDGTTKEENNNIYNKGAKNINSHVRLESL